LRGGSHVHVWDAVGHWVSFTYEDHVLARFKEETPDHQINLRNVGVSIPGHTVKVPRTHPRNQDGDYFSVLVTRTWANPEPGSDQIKRAFEEGWVGTNGYMRLDGSTQKHALVFQGQVVMRAGETISEVFIVDLPDDLTVPGEGPLAGTETQRPFPPKGTVQRRLTFTSERKFPGLQGPRHWLRSSPSGNRIAFLMKDDAGVVQLWTVSPNGGPLSQVTHNRTSIASAFTWNPDGTQIAHVMDNSVCVTKIEDGITTRVTSRSQDAQAPRPEACVFSPDGSKIAFVRPTRMGHAWLNQIWVVEMPKL
jgi:WD40 repeat protein